jgi:hypothetical protein
LESPGFILCRTGERTLAITEKLRFQKTFGQGCAIESNKWPILAGAELMNGPGNQFLARAGRPFDDNGTVTFGNVRQERDDFIDPGMPADDVVRRETPLGTAPQGLQFGDIPKRLNGADDGTGLVFQDGRAQADRFGLTALSNDARRLVDLRFRAFQSVIDRTVSFADIGAENVKTVLTDGFFRFESRDGFGSLVEGDNAFVSFHLRISRSVLTRQLVDLLLQRVQAVHDIGASASGTVMPLRKSLNQCWVLVQTLTSISITGTSISTPTTVARAAPEDSPNSMVAVAMATSKWFDAPIMAAGAASA